jgi:ubiquinone/menaquinone biosynthesis C-methylase UbiE
MTDVFDLAGHGPAAYQRFLVPVLFTECAERLLDVAAPEPGDRVLDVACGTGIVTRLAASRATLGRLVGCDLNDAMLDVARSVASGCGAEWRRADAAALPFADGGFDVVYCQQGLQYVPDRLAGLREMARVLAPGGRLALALWRPIEHNPGFALLTEALDRRVGPAAADVMRSPFAGPGPDPLRELLERAGFDGVVSRIAVFAARFPSTREFLRQQVLASPGDGLARLTAEAAPGAAPRWDVVAGDLAGALSPFTDDEGVLLPVQTWLVTAKRAAATVPEL